MCRFIYSIVVTDEEFDNHLKVDFNKTEELVVDYNASNMDNAKHPYDLNFDQVFFDKDT